MDQKHESALLSGSLIPTAAPLNTVNAGQAADIARQGVLRVICKSTRFGGTGFLYGSGAVLTAAHVVAGCSAADLLLLDSDGRRFGVSKIDSDEARDLALLVPSPAISGVALPIAEPSVPDLGSQVTTWGFPGGYDGLVPLLSVGYFSGVQDFRAKGGTTTVRRWVVNAAFNGGNSGGPLISVEAGRVIGVVSSKLAPLPEEIKAILATLTQQKFGMQYTATRPDGSKVALSEAQLVGEVLNYLRSQVQLVIGYSVTTDDLVAFLKEHDVTP